MAAPRLVIELTIEEEDVTKLMAVARSRTEPASRVERARMLLAYRDEPSFFAVVRLLGVHHQTVRRCIERAAALGPLAALDDSAQPGDDNTRG
jgi:Winged helix-turn helix